MARSLDPLQLESMLRILGVPNRITLLRKLQVPRTVSEIDLTPSRKSHDGRADRSISRQAVERHLHQLETLGVVQSRAARRDGRPVTEYVVNHARLFVMADELRRISLLRPAAASETAPPSTSYLGAAVHIPEGPALVLATGPMEGAVFELQGSGPWLLGRDRNAQVPLAYDPFVSKENSLITRNGSGLVIADLQGSRNGTSVNWKALEAGETAPLRPGDAIGVGRSLLFVRGV